MDDENHFQLEDGIIPVVKEVKRNWLFLPLKGCGCSGWQGRDDVSENAIPLLERLRTRDVSARPQLK